MAAAKPKKTTRRTRAAQGAARPKAKATPTTKRPAAASRKQAAQPAPEPVKRRFRRTPKAARPQYSRLPNVIKLTRTSYDLLARNWKLIVGIALIYGLLNVLLVRGLNGGLNVSELKSQFEDLYKGGWDNFASGLSVFALLVSSSNSGTASDAAGAYQSFLVIVTSLALVWSFRQVLADRSKLRIRDAFYQGMYPLVPVILVLLIIGLQLIPMLLGGLLFSIVIANGIAVTGVEVAFWFILFLGSVLTSLLLITPSVFALYIASLPDMTPLKALRSAKKLVRFRRPTVLRKLLFLPILILLLLSVIILPIIFVVPVLAQWVFFVLSMFILPAVHAYIYTLYRELLNE